MLSSRARARTLQLSKQLSVGDICHARGIPFIAADMWGVFAKLFVDCGAPCMPPLRSCHRTCHGTKQQTPVFLERESTRQLLLRLLCEPRILLPPGKSFDVVDVDGEEPLQSMIANITQAR